MWPFLCFCEKKLLTISLALNGKKPGVLNFYKLCHITKHVTSKGPKSALLFKVKSYLCHPSKSCIYTTSYLTAIHTATKKHNIITYFGLLSFSIINPLKAILLSIHASYVNYLTVPLQRYSLHSFLLSHWEGLLVLVLL